MKTNLFITVLCLLLFAASGLAQVVEQRAADVSPPVVATPPTQEELLQMQFEEQYEEGIQRAMMKGMVRSVWNGQGAHLLTYMGLDNAPTVATAWGISEAQLEKLADRLDSMGQMNDLIQAAEHNIVVEMGIPIDEHGASLDDWEPDRETMMNMQTIMENAMDTMGAMMNTTIADAFDEVLTPEQLQTIQESQLANMEALPFFSPSAFEALDLSDIQKEQMEQIRQEYTPEFETMLDSWVDGFIAMEKRLSEEEIREEEIRIEYPEFPVATREYEEGQPLAPDEMIFMAQRGNGEVVRYIVDQAAMDEFLIAANEFTGKTDLMLDYEIRKKLLAEDPEYKRLSEEMQSKSKAFAENFKTQMFDVLTDEQWERLQQLIAHPPEHALAFRKALRELLGGSDEVASATSESSSGSHDGGMWIPGPGAWQPGDGIHEGYRIERNTRSRFPREEN